MQHAAEGAATKGRLALFVAWATLLVLGGLYIRHHLQIGADLRLFMPSPQTQEQRLLLDEVGEGPASRLLLVAIEGAPAESLADVSRSLAATLHGDPAIRWVANGEPVADVVPERLLPYRYLLSANMDRGPFDAASLARSLTSRARDLASPAAGLLEPWIPRDPTLETLQLLESWQPQTEPERRHEVWFDRAGRRALLLVETAAAGFDPAGQASTLQRLQAAFAAAKSPHGTRLIISGPGAFSVLMQERAVGEARRFGTIAAISMVLLMFAAYRSVALIVLGALPLASAGVAGLAAVSAAFGEVHGITLAFGFTLIGVAQDYPLHLFSHQRRDLRPLDNARALWPTLATGVASTCIAYLAFLVSGVPGLAQVAVFTVAGLAVAGLGTRYLLPRIIAAEQPDRGDSRPLQRLWQVAHRLPRPRLAVLALAAVCVIVIALAPGRTWQDQLSNLLPVPVDLVRQDVELREQLGAPDVRHLIVIEAASADAALERVEALGPVLDSLVRAGVIRGYDHAARYVPSRATQLRRQRALPPEAELRQSLASALTDQPFRAATFEPFIADVATARGLAPLLADDLSGTPLAARLEGLLRTRPSHAIALVTISGLEDAVQLRAAVSAPGITLLDMKQASEDLVAGQRTRILQSLALAFALLVLVVWAALRQGSRALRVLGPMVLATLVVLAVLRVTGVSLTMFHVIALVLAAGLGLDYALFFEHAAGDPRGQRRTLHAVLLSAVSTFMVFALLSLSALPVLQAIGVTVAIGVAANFVLALWLTPPAPRSGPA